MHGFHGRLLHIDLSTGRISWHDLAASRLREVLGGIGLGTSLLYDYATQGVDPFSPANPLIFTSAPLVGTGLTTTAKFAVVTDPLLLVSSPTRFPPATSPSNSSA